MLRVVEVPDEVEDRVAISVVVGVINVPGEAEDVALFVVVVELK